MICKSVLGNLGNYDVKNKAVDTLDLEWYETTKRVMRKLTRSNSEVIIKFFREGNRLCEGDIVFEDSHCVIAINILPCEAIEVKPRSVYEMGTVCYEIGNMHIPLFIQNDHVLVPYEGPLERLLLAKGYEVKKTHCKLMNMLKANLATHRHGTQGKSLFSKIMEMTT